MADPAISIQFNNKIFHKYFFILRKKSKNSICFDKNQNILREKFL